MRSIIASMTLALFYVASGEAQTTQTPGTRHPLEGVWARVAGTVNGEVVSNQPGYRMFIDGHYSWVWVGGMTPRMPAPERGATAAQVRDANRLTAAAGRYELSSVITYNQRGDQVTLNPAGMEPGAYNVYSHRIVGDTLWTAGIMSQAGPTANPQMGKYIRVGRRVSNAVEGAWRHVEGRAADGSVVNNQPGYRLYVDGHYAVVRVNGTSPRPALPGADVGAAEQFLAVYGPYAAQHGTYELSGQTITERPLVTKAPDGMTDPAAFTTQGFRVLGDTLWVTNMGNQSGPTADGVTGKYLRVRATPPGPN